MTGHGAAPVFLDVGAKRIQTYLARTPRLRGRRGASALLDRDRLLAWTRPAWTDCAAENPDGKRTDGQLSLRFTDGVAADRVQDVAAEVAVLLQRLAPAAEWEVAIRSGADYDAAVAADAALRRAGRDGFTALPPPPAEVPLVRSCQACGISAAVVHSDRVDPTPGETLAICADCSRRFVEGGLRTDRREWSQAQAEDEWQKRLRPGGLAAERRLREAVEAATGRPIGAVESFAELAALGGGDANHLATVCVDGNRFGDLFAELKGTGVRSGELSGDLAAAAHAALAAATVAVTRNDDAYVPVVPHLVGGDDLLASVTADRAWTFVLEFLTGYEHAAAGLAAEYGRRAGKPIPAPTASAGIAFAHHKRPFADALQLADTALHRAKAEHKARVPAVCWVDVTTDGPEVPAGRPAPALAALRERSAELDALHRIPAAGRARLAEVVDDDVAVAALAHRLGNAAAVRPFLLPERLLPLADALVLERWWPRR